MPHLKLVYFRSRGRAEPIRMILSYGGVPFEDVRLPGPELFKARDEGTLKPPFGQFPYLEIDGKPLGQSATILRYAAKLAGLYPADEYNGLVAESLAEQITDIGTAFYGVASKPEDERAAALKAYTETTLPKLFKGVLAQLDGKKFFFGEQPSFADFFLYNLVMYFRGQANFDYAEHVPRLKALVHDLENLPQVQQYIAKRAENEAAEAAAAKATA